MYVYYSNCSEQYVISSLTPEKKKWNN